MNTTAVFIRIRNFAMREVSCETAKNAKDCNIDLNMNTTKVGSVWFARSHLMDDSICVLCKMHWIRR